MSSMRDYADKSYLNTRNVCSEETPVQKVITVFALAIFIVAMGLMMFAGPTLQSAT